jgi:flagellar assembly protein FliH
MSSDWRVNVFEYPSVPVRTDHRDDGGESQLWSIEPQRSRNHDTSLREAQARELGHVEGEAKARKEFEDALKKERERIGEALTSFQKQRTEYFEEVEAEVVQLALSIARKLLRREVQVDPDMLIGLVRYTLEKLRDGTQVKLRVNPALVASWVPVLAEQAEVVGDARLERGTCVVETEMGTTTVNVESQLKEIEQGLLDLLARRPGGE